MATEKDGTAKNRNLYFKITGIIFLIAGILGITLGSVDRLQGFFVSDLGLWSSLFTFMTGVGGLLSYIDASATAFPYAVCCVTLFVTEIATTWTGAISVRKTSEWCAVSQREVINLTTSTLPKMTISTTCSASQQDTVLFIEYIIIAVSCFVMVTAMVTVVKQGYNLWKTLFDKSQGSLDIDQTTSPAEIIRRSHKNKAPNDFRVSSVSHSLDEFSSQSISSLPQADNPRFNDDDESVTQ